MGSMPAKYKPGQELTGYADAASITGGRFVKVSADKNSAGDYVMAHAGAGQHAVGVAQSDADHTLPTTAQARRSNVVTGGVARVTAGGSISAGGEVQSDANGKAVAKTTGVSLGIAMHDAANDETVEVMLHAPSPGGPATGNAYAQGTQVANIADVPTAGSATAADNATAINSIIAALEEFGIAASS